MKLLVLTTVAALGLMAVPCLADGATDDSEITVLPLSELSEGELPQSTATDTEALSLPSSGDEAAAPASGCRGKSGDTVYLTN